MKRWEYHNTIKTYDEDLDTLGKGGWELISIVPGSDYNQGYDIFYFKREL